MPKHRRREGPSERVSNIDRSEVTAFARRNGQPVPARLDGDPPDPWRISAEIEDQEPTPGLLAPDPPVNFSHFTLELMRPDPLILSRARLRRRLRKSDWWHFAFEGDASLVRRVRAMMMLTVSTFARGDDDRERRRWIALHYLARMSPVLVQSAKGDAPDDRPAPTRRLDHRDRETAAAILSRDLHVRDKKLVRETLDAFQQFLDRLGALPDELLSRQVVDNVLGLRADDKDDALYATMPDLTDDERAEKDRLTALAMRGALDPEGQTRLLPLLKRHTAHVKARLRNPQGSASARPDTT